MEYPIKENSNETRHMILAVLSMSYAIPTVLFNPKELKSIVRQKTTKIIAIIR